MAVVLYLSVAVVQCPPAEVYTGGLFVEQFTSPDFDLNTWEINTGGLDGLGGTTGNPLVGNGTTGIEEVAPGDYAAYTLGPKPYDMSDWKYAFWLRNLTFPRTDRNTRCTFLAWQDPGKDHWAATGQHPCIQGPFHFSKNYVAIYGNMTAAISGWVDGGDISADQVKIRYATRAWNAPNDPAITQGHFNAWQNALSKSSALHYRVTLAGGDTVESNRGALFEWSTDGLSWTVGHDNRGTSDPEVRSDASVVLGFGTHATAVFIDDIRVEDDDNPVTGGVAPLNLSRHWVVFE